MCRVCSTAEPLSGLRKDFCPDSARLSVTNWSTRHGWWKRFRGGLVFEAHRLLYHSTLGFRVMKKKKKGVGRLNRKRPYLRLIDFGGQVEQQRKDAKGWTPLHAAAARNQVSLTLSFSLSHTLSLSHTHSFYTHALSHSLTLSLSLSLAHSLSHTCTHTLSLQGCQGVDAPPRRCRPQYLAHEKQRPPRTLQ